MNARFLLPLVISLSCAAAQTTAPPDGAKAEAAKPAKPATAEKKKSKKDGAITISVVPGALRYATTRFDVTAGTPFSITLKNTCVMPHNLVLGRPGKADEIVVQAMALADRAFAKNFIPDSADVIAATKVVSPGQEEKVAFQVPGEPGEYPYLCTFPGHGTIMRGIMRVRAAGEALEKPVTEKLTGPKLVDALRESEVNARPMGSRQRPMVVRTFVTNPDLDDRVLAHHDRGLPVAHYNPATGQDDPNKMDETVHGIPGGIAVSFGPEFAYVWDSTECRLLYAWTGGFLDLWPYWGPGTGGGRRGRDYRPFIEGTLVYKAAGALPLQAAGGSQARPRFRGYRLLSGNPEFMYEVGGRLIHEHIVPTEPGTFMIHYRLDDPREPVRLVFDPAIRPQISCDQGSWKGDTLEIPADHADHFMLLVKFVPGQTFKPDAAPTTKVQTSEEP